MKLELRNVHKSYGDHHVLKGIDLTVESGRAMGLLGRNGSGKTTMIRGIMDVFEFDEGEIQLVAKPDEIGYLPEERGVYPKSSLLKQMMYFAMLKDMDKQSAKDRAMYWLERMDLLDYANKKADNLSKGNQQKIQLAIALMHDPKVLILDEPFSGLDPVNSELLKQIVREEIKKDKIVFFSSHQMSAVEEFCDDIAILNQGKIVLSGELTAIKDNYPKEYVELFTRNQTLLKDLLITEYQYQDVVIKSNSVILKVFNSEEIIAEVKDLANSITEIEGFRVVEPTLDEIFIQYARESL